MSNTELQTVSSAPLAPAPRPSIEALIQHALEHQTPVETMERLLAMAEKVKAQQAEEAYNVALAAFQADCPVIVKAHRGNDNRYNYAKLEDIVGQTKALLQKHGLHYAFTTSHNGELLTVRCIVTHAAGHSRTSEATFPLKSSAGMSDQQKVGSAMTYAKRYALMNALGVVVADEDNDAAFPTPNPKPDADASAPHAPTRRERAEASPIAAGIAKVAEAYKAKFPGNGKAAFLGWVQNTLKSSDDFSDQSKWSERDINICLEALQ